MSQAEIMEFLDKHPGKYFSTNDLVKQLNISRTLASRGLKRIIKRQSYVCLLTYKTGTNCLIAMYCKEEQNGRNKTN